MNTPISPLARIEQAIDAGSVMFLLLGMGLAVAVFLLGA
jgi:hypothetical protein